MTEVWNAYDLNRNQLPHLLVRGEKIPEGQFHLCVNVLVRHQDGDILFMRRSANKSLYSGYYEFGAGRRNRPDSRQYKTVGAGVLCRRPVPL